MKRVAFTAAVIGLALLSSPAMAGLTNGEKSKLGRYLADCLSPFGDSKKRIESWKQFTDFFEKKQKAKDLASVADMTELLANAGDRPNQRSGVLEMELDPKDVGLNAGPKWKYLINVPRKYSGNAKSDAWPLIVVIPDKGQTLQQCMEKYWKNKDIRESYLIAVIGFDYSDLEVEEQKEIKDDDGKVHMEAVKVKTPFSWDRVEAYIRFWKHIYNLQLREFKVNPNRIIVDGVGFGREGVMEFASGSAWRLAGVIDRGLESDKPVVQNLQYMKVLYLPSAASEKPSDKMKEMLGGALTEGTVDAAWSASSEDGGAASLKQWLDSCVRARYPLPCKWVANERAQDFGYWTFVTRRFDANSPVEISVAADKAKNQVLVTCTNVAQFTLYVNDDLVDMDKAVTLVVNGKEGKPVTLTRSADQLLAHSFAHNDGKLPRDPGCVFTNEIRDVAVAAPPKEEKKDAGAEEKKPADKAAEDGKKPEEGAGGGDGK